MRATPLLALALVLAFVALAPAASATFASYGPGPLAFSGVASNCLVALTPVGSTPAFVLQNFVGTINGGPVSAMAVAVWLTAGTVDCAPLGAGFSVSSAGAVGTALSGP
ncbi:MAG: hypothetical protein ACYDCK_14055 [Thermoplasmatota archaeon]